ncbi:LysR family transcriptional regulator [Streptomyces sp. NPDC091292]|uniref:LysR family transcriptional regulator n=1 Tax=Streptomyces sp. NPDC091292 TaxID=3365991 RepID=UPI003807F01A
MLDVRKLVMLREVSFRGSITAAAQALNYTRSAVSQQISALEMSVGVPLLRRHGATLSLTEAGEELVAHTDRVLDELRAAEASLANRRGEPEGMVRIGLPVREGPPGVGEALAEVHQRYPRLTVDLHSLPPADAVRDLRRGLLDMTLCAHYPSEGDSASGGLHAYDLGQDAVRLFVRADHPLSAKDSCDLRALAGEPWVLGTRTPLGDLVLTRCRGAGFEPRVVASVDDLNTTLRLVNSGWGIALAPELTPHPPDSDLVAIALTDVHILRTSQLLVRADDRFTPRISVIVSAIEEKSRDRWPGGT